MSFFDFVQSDTFYNVALGFVVCLVLSFTTLCIIDCSFSFNRILRNAATTSAIAVSAAQGGYHILKHYDECRKLLDKKQHDFINSDLEECYRDL